MVYTFSFLGEEVGNSGSVVGCCGPRLLKRELLLESCVEETVWGLRVNGSMMLVFVTPRQYS